MKAGTYYRLLSRKQKCMERIKDVEIRKEAEMGILSNNETEKQENKKNRRKIFY